MDLPSPVGPRDTSPTRTVLVGVAIAAPSLAAGAVAAWLLVALVRLLIHFLQDHWPWLVGVLVLSVMAVALIAMAGAYARYEAEQRELRLATLARFERVDVMSGTEFEEFVAELLRRDGYSGVEVIGKSGDRGVDITAMTPDGHKIAIQCKRQGRNVPADRIRNLIGAVHSTYSGHVGVLVTNSGFTAQAQAEGDGLILMVGRDELGDWMTGEALVL